MRTQRQRLARAECRFTRALETNPHSCYLPKRGSRNNPVDRCAINVLECTIELASPPAGRGSAGQNGLEHLFASELGELGFSLAGPPLATKRLARYAVQFPEAQKLARWLIRSGLAIIV